MENLGNEDLPSVVLDPPLGTTSLPFLLLNSLNLWGLTSDLTGTSKRTVDLNNNKLIGGEQDLPVFSICSVPELHVMEGITNHL